MPLFNSFCKSVRQIFDNSSFKHIFIMNGLKYLLSIITVLFSYAYVITDQEVTKLHVVETLEILYLMVGHVCEIGAFYNHLGS